MSQAFLFERFLSGKPYSLSIRGQVVWHKLNYLAQVRKVILLEINQGELADMVGMHRVTVLHAIRDLKEAGFIKVLHSGVGNINPALYLMVDVRCLS